MKHSAVAKEGLKKAGIVSGSNTSSVVLSGKEGSGEVDGYITDFSASTIEDDESDDGSLDSYVKDMGFET